MAVRSRETLKGYFRKGRYPTEGQFSDLIDSLRHKGESVAISDVAGLAAVLNAKYDGALVAGLEHRVTEAEKWITNLRRAAWGDGGEVAVVISGRANIPEMGVLDEAARGDVSVWYSTALGRFVAAEGSGPGTRYYAEWERMDDYLSDGRPRMDRIYLDVGLHTLYLWDGNDLVNILAGEPEGVAFFDGEEAAGDVDFSSSPERGDEEGCLVVFDPERGRFLMRSRSGWHNLWADAGSLGTADLQGVVPSRRMLYVRRDDMTAFCFDGTGLVPLAGAGASFPSDVGLMSEDEAEQMVDEIFGDFRFHTSASGNLSAAEVEEMVDEIFGPTSPSDCDKDFLSDAEALDMVNSIF